MKPGTLKSTVSLTAEQMEVADIIACRGGFCSFCGTVMVPDERRGLLAQPHSSVADKISARGNIVFIGFCNSCFEDIADAMKRCKAKKTKQEAPKP